MCGLFGWQFSELPKGWAGAAVALAWANESRGDHSYGFTDEQGSIRKDSKSIANAPLSIIARQRQLTGHTRWASTGQVSVLNAHPFSIGNIVGSHNGIVNNHYLLNTKYNRRFEVDSQHIFAHIDEGIDTSEISGYGTIQYFSKDKPDRINLLKFNGGELSVWAVKVDGEHIGIVWSSERYAVDEALQLAELQGTEYRLDENMVYAVYQNNIWNTSQSLPFAAHYTSKSWKDFDSSISTYSHKYSYDKYKYNNYSDSTAKSTSSIVAKVRNNKLSYDKYDRAYTKAWNKPEPIGYLAKFAAYLECKDRNDFLDYVYDLDQDAAIETALALRNDWDIETNISHYKTNTIDDSILL